jgi:endonuclease/exonuclease/phosphatase family metal-dependent hydrolase
MRRNLLILIALFACNSAFSQFVWDEKARSGQRRVRKLEKAAGLKIFWWNIMYGGLSQKRELADNFKTLISEMAPDILALGEYNDRALTPETLNLLESTYPFQHYFAYGKPKRDLGIKVFSKHKFSARQAIVMDWVPFNLSAEEDENYRNQWHKVGRMNGQHTNWFFPYQVLDFEKFSLIPIHLNQPWNVMRFNHGAGTTFRHLLFRDDNPHGYQVKRLRKLLEKDLSSGREFIMFGDFNIPRRLLGVRPKIARQLKKDLVEVYRDGVKTFPAKSAPERGVSIFKIHKIKIDMAFHTAGFKTSAKAVLPLKGSDHYPLYFVLKARD